MDEHPRKLTVFSNPASDTDHGHGTGHGERYNIYSSHDAF